MPVPLIAAGLLLLGGASGSGGVALGGKGALDIKKAKRRLKDSESRYFRGRVGAERSVAEANDDLRRYGDQQAHALQAVVVRMGEFLRRNAKQVRESERLLVDGIEASAGAVVKTPPLDQDAVTWVMGLVKSGVAGAGVSAGVTTAVGTYGVASTGAAISGLSGAAAESATLAFLGGGSLASGGGGVALGTTVLNFVTVGPALLVGGFVVKGQGEKALTRAREYEAKVAVELERLAAEQSRLGLVRTRVRELTSLLSELRGRAVKALNSLESEAFEPDRHADRFQQALNLVLAVRDIAATPVVETDGTLSDRADRLVIKYRPMMEEQR